MRVDCLLSISLPAAGGQFEPDWACRTNLLINGEWKLSFTWPAFEVGQAFGLSIPSGDFTGVIQRARSGEDLAHDEEGQVLTAEGTWDGQYAGIAGGLCAYGCFQTWSWSDITTSAWNEPVPPGLYIAAHGLADQLGLYGRPEARREALRRIIGLALELRRQES